MRWQSVVGGSGYFLLGYLLLASGACGSDQAATEEPCAPGLERCPDGCFDLMSNDGHCGSCISACGGGLVCSEGACVAGCPEGEERCGGDCADTQSDTAHCGGCDAPCTAPDSCVMGQCVSADPCGDGTLDPGEECDDGNDTPGDGCDGSCVVECAGPDTFKDPASNHCYAYVSTQRSWENARIHCTQIGLGWNLVALTNQAERDFIDDVVNIAFDTWTGGNDITNEGVWEWSNGEPWSYEPWLVGEPNGSGDCARLVPLSGTGNDALRDSYCFTTYPQLCELTPAGE